MVHHCKNSAASPAPIGLGLQLADSVFGFFTCRTISVGQSLENARIHLYGSNGRTQMLLQGPEGISAEQVLERGS